MRLADSLKPRKSGAQERSRETVTVILQGAARIFAQRGYIGGTTNHIAARAGVSVGTLYQYFPNKEAILVALAEHHLDMAETVVREAMAETAAQFPPPDLRDVIRRFVQATIAIHAKEPALHRVLFEECPQVPRVRRRTLELQRQAGEWAGAYLSSHPQVRCKDPIMAGRLVAQMVDALTHNWVIRDDDARRNIERYVDETVELIVNYLTAPPQPETVPADRTMGEHTEERAVAR